MAGFLISGGQELHGTVWVYGAKNAALKAMAAALLTEEPVCITNTPDIVDVARMKGILESIGAGVAWDKKNRTLTVTAKNIFPERIDTTLVGMLRASVVLLGPLLARFGEVRLPRPGGDNIGARPLTTHLAAFQKLGADVLSDGPVLHLKASAGKLKPARVVLREFSVTATENILMAASLLDGTTTIEIAAAEPHVANLAELLGAMGARVHGGGTHTLTVVGKNKLVGVNTHHLVPDMLDASTFLIAGLATGGDVTVEDAYPVQLALVSEKLQEMGANVTQTATSIRAKSTPKGLVATTIQALPYPGIPSDLQAPFAVLATQATGASSIHDPLFENRFRYLPELERMGARVRLLDAHRAEITGPTPLSGIPITSFDIRAGAAMVIAGLAASGETRIEGVEHIDRGYEDLDGRLRMLGARIERI